MRARYCSCSSILAAFAMLCASRTAHPQIHYAALNLGIPFAGLQKELAINNNGWIAGVTPIGGQNRAFVFDGVTTTIFGTFGGATSAALAINDGNVIAGRAGTGTGASHGFHHAGPPPLNPATDDVGTLGGSTSVANGINNSGVVVGRSQTAGGDQHAFLYDGTIHDIDSLGGGFSSAFDINGSGMAAGVAADINGFNRAFVYDTTMHDLGVLGGDNSEAFAINDSGLITGDADNVDGVAHAFVYDGTMHDLGTLGNDPFLISSGYDINASGQIVGYSDMDNFDSHAFLYDGATMFDLNALLLDPAGWDINFAYGINDSGWIAAVGTSPTSSGDVHVLLLRPAAIPEPGGIALMTAGVVACGWTLRRRTRASV
jgi:probable HAF family extracellular repeat protein